MDSSDLSAILAKHQDVAGVSVAISYDFSTIKSVSAGYACLKRREPLTTRHYLQCASLSKTIAAAFAIEYFSKRGIPMSTSVNSLLAAYSSSWLICLPPDNSTAIYSPDSVTLAMLVNHTALGMHYVYGIPMSHPTPSPMQLLDGSCKNYGYDALYLLRRPGESFAYSGGGFIVLQLLLETMESKPIQEITQDFLNRVGLREFTFSHENIDGKSYAMGHLSRSKQVQPDDGGRLKFSPFAAGAVCTPESLLAFLMNIAKAYNSFSDNEDHGISRQTARLMLGESGLLDLGAVEFMRAKVGLGVFVATAGPNKIMLHQAANDGFRGVYMVCFEGPDAGKGFVILANGDNPAVFLQCELAKFLLNDSGGKGLNISGTNFDRLENSAFDMKGLKQETIVNLGLRDLVLAAFEDPYADSQLHRLDGKSKL